MVGRNGGLLLSWGHSEFSLEAVLFQTGWVLPVALRPAPRQCLSQLGWTVAAALLLADKSGYSIPASLPGSLGMWSEKWRQPRVLGGSPRPSPSAGELQWRPCLPGRSSCALGIHRNLLSSILESPSALAPSLSSHRWDSGSLWVGLGRDQSWIGKWLPEDVTSEK